MDKPNITCCLCNIKLIEGELKQIFDEDDLARKINETLSLNISSDDNDHSKCVCLECYEKVDRHYNFKQNVLALSKKRADVKETSFSFETSNKNEEVEVAAIFKQHDGMIYTCPNCNMNLMIVIKSNPDDCNYPFQTSLANADQVEKFRSKNVQIPKNSENLDKRLIVMDEEYESSCIVANDNTQNTNDEAHENLLMLQNAKCDDTYITFSNTDVLHETTRNKNEEFRENICVEIATSDKSHKTKSDNKACESNADLLKCDYADDLATVESEGIDVEWLVIKVDDKEDGNAENAIETQKDYVEEENVMETQKDHVEEENAMETQKDHVEEENAIETQKDYVEEEDTMETQKDYVEEEDAIETQKDHVEEENAIETQKDYVEEENAIETQKDHVEEESAMETQKNHVKEDHCSKGEDVKSYPRICPLCGARYLSQIKYDFHMERHKLNKIDKYVCLVCDKEVSSENLLWEHYFYIHKSSVRYACATCGKIFTRKPRLKSHQKKHKHFGIKEVHFETITDEADVDHETRRAIAIEVQGPTTIKCCLCLQPITDIDPDGINDLATCAKCEDSGLSLMVDGSGTKTITPRQYHCSKCPKHFVRKERLEFHEMRHNENMNELICSTCGKEFSAENSLYEHYLFVHKGARPHVCELCGKSFQLKARLKEHHRTHTGERPYQCDLCTLRCMTTNALKLHRKTHFSQNRYACNICSKSFSKKQNMNEHLEKHWKSDKNVSLPQRFTCPICAEDLPTYRMLKFHMTKTHKIDHLDPLLTEQKPWHECNKCHEKFKHQMSLKAHKERVHEGRVSPIFQCNTCSITYKIKQLLINHIRSKHGYGEKRYKCAQCSKGFNDTKSLYNHILLHTGRKPFACEYCGMNFRRKDSRDHHRRRHTGEQPYPCPDCDQSFSTYNNRSKHRKKEHGEGEIECPECGQKCSSQQEVRMHLNKHLGEKLNVLKCE